MTPITFLMSLRTVLIQIMQAYADCGMRAHVSIDQPNVVEYDKYPYLTDLLPDEIRQEMKQAPIRSADDLIALYEWFIDRWNGACDGRLRCAVSCSAPQRVTTDYLARLNDLSREHGLAYYIHVLETKLQRVLGREKYGKSLVRYLHDQGVLNERCNIIHSIWVDDDDIRLLAESGCTVAHQPLCNMKIGSGVMPFRRLRDHNIPICLGSDESNTDDSANMWTVAKAAGLIHKLSDPEYRNWPKAPEILHCLIGGAARAMQLTGQVGMLKAGYEADLILLDLNTLNFTPLNDLRRQLVYCEDGTSVEMTMVAGNIVYRDGKLLTVNEEAIKAEVRELMATYGKEIDAISDSAARLEPYYREMYLRAAAQNVDMNRWVG
ncbi:putative amidohydrolase family protein (plasmid) [Sinorhizobium fredii HH103]|uniref:Amidohydrolase family protein n=1 Tax=Sinorhizobium fredii (strain HH103) TaxID=1117943 RepID=G9AJ81_SINF1|nr:putative amidohydrolase family protein [Sinorhizobium fredii HH103]